MKKLIPRPEHPKPQFQRETWMSLNGNWTFEFDFGRSGDEKGFPASKGFSKTLLFLFAPKVPCLEYVTQILWSKSGTKE